MNQCMITTGDNPNNPFTHYDEWLSFDTEKGYNSERLLAFYSKASVNMTEEEYNQATSDAIDHILELNVSGRHIKVYENDADKFIKLANEVFKDLDLNT